MDLDLLSNPIKGLRLFFSASNQLVVACCTEKVPILVSVHFHRVIALTTEKLLAPNGNRLWHLNCIY